ncbi:MAG: zinc-dependent metalloprotease, partial [Planctomycetota bacterium]|nr:zinc-dependent metalloprotease [Planctomycetota bacterium]
NGDDPVEALNLSMRVRRIALDNFGADNIAPGQPLALLHETLVPVYLHHRFQLTAATKIIGGLHYNYALNGDGQDLSRPIDPALQRQALEAVLACIDPIELDLSDEILELVHPRPFGYSGNRELFGSSTSPAFDAVGAAQTAAHIAVRGLLHPDRCARLVDFHRRDDSMPSLEEVFATIIAASFGDSADSNSRIQELRFVIRNVVVVELINLAQNTNATISVRSRADEALNGLVMEFEGDPHVRALMDLIERYQRRELNSPLSPARALPVPPGDPIGMAPELMDDWCGWSRPG